MAQDIIMSEDVAGDCFEPVHVCAHVASHLHISWSRPQFSVMNVIAHKRDSIEHCSIAAVER